MSYALARVDVDVIDATNILEATMRAMRVAVDAGSTRRRTQVLVDGNRCPDLRCPARAVVRGDAAVAGDQRRVDPRQGGP